MTSAQKIDTRDQSKFSRKGVVVIPAFGRVDLTQSIVAQCLAEVDTVHTVVVDNAGDFVDPGAAVTVLRPSSNLGWLRGTNLGFSWALERGAAWCVGLNNDTMLSPKFFDGLQVATSLSPGDLIAPCYDDVVRDQSRYYKGPADEFPVGDREHAASLIDGTCFSMSASLISRVGLLDEKYFGRHGWGAIDDLILRVRATGGTCRVTERSYLQHDTGATAKSVLSSYSRYAYAEMRRGMRRKWGANWREHFPQFTEPKDSFRVRAGDSLRELEERLGLAETWIGRR